MRPARTDGGGLMNPITMSGPLFDGTFQRRVAVGIEDAKHEITDQGYAMVRSDLHAVLKAPTGHLESQVRVHAVGADLIVDDGGVIYGAWIEGVGSRNSRTRFKGYHTYRRVAQGLRQRATAIATRAVGRRIGGTS
jgi:hypothetical protein